MPYVILIAVIIIAIITAISIIRTISKKGENVIIYEHKNRTLDVILLYLLPIVLLILFSLGITPDYRYGLGKTYLSLIDAGGAGLAILPLFILGVARVLSALQLNKISKVDMFIQFSFGLQAFWITIRYIEDITFMAFFTVLYGIAHTLIGIKFYYLAPKAKPINDIIYSVSWFLGIVATYVYKIIAAKKLFEELPPNPPNCFIVTAAGKGHQNFVGSFFSPAHNKIITRQLIIFYQFEYYLMGNFPRFHKGLRRVYNTVGPHIAKRIRTRWIADLVYLLLKPLEYLILLILMLRK